LSPSFPVAFPDAEQPKAVVPVLRGKGLGEQVRSLLLRVDIEEGDVWILKLLVDASEVDLVRAANVAEFGAPALAHDLYRGFVVLHDL